MGRGNGDEERRLVNLHGKDDPEAIESDEMRPDIVLSARHQAFVDAYLGPARFDGKEAARLAGYKPTDNNLSVVACVLLRKADVKAVIPERTRRRQDRHGIVPL